MMEDYLIWLVIGVAAFVYGCYKFRPWEEPLASLELQAAEALHGNEFPNHWLIHCSSKERYVFFHPRYVAWARDYFDTYEGYLRLVIEQGSLDPVSSFHSVRK